MTSTPSGPVLIAGLRPLSALTGSLRQFSLRAFPPLRAPSLRVLESGRLPLRRQKKNLRPQNNYKFYSTDILDKFYKLWYYDYAGTSVAVLDSPGRRERLGRGCIMAKVTGPLMSMDARGQLGKTLVYLGWKGLRTVRGYVVPANPQSAAQTSHRTVFTNAVDEWHDDNLTAADKTAWDVYAKTLARIMSGFNAFVKAFVDVDVAGDTWALMFGGADVSAGAGRIGAEINTDTGLDVSLRYGESPSSLINTEEMVEDGTSGKYEKSVTSLTSGSKYYFQFYVTTEANEGSESGIYEFTCT